MNYFKYLNLKKTYKNESVFEECVRVVADQKGLQTWLDPSSGVFSASSAGPRIGRVRAGVRSSLRRLQLHHTGSRTHALAFLLVEQSSLS